jgi:uncharacterized protein
MKISFALAGAVFLLGAAEARAQSFNCNYAASPAEVAICQDGQLGSLDQEMAQLYFDLINTAPPWAVRRIKSEQRRFIARRNACGYSGQCLLGTYRRRIAQLYVWSERIGY